MRRQGDKETRDRETGRRGGYEMKRSYKETGDKRRETGDNSRLKIKDFNFQFSTFNLYSLLFTLVIP
jgi:hypothetical protein